LAEIACKLEASRENSPLWDIIGYTHRLEAAFTTMMLRRQKGVAADHIDVRALQAEL
jgi:predicted O-linked N-acetylglucosamine transferase (SPINDLY family)